MCVFMYAQLLLRQLLSGFLNIFFIGKGNIILVVLPSPSQDMIRACHGY